MIRHLSQFILLGALVLMGTSTFGCVSKKQLNWKEHGEGSYRAHVQDWMRADQIYDGIVARSTAKAVCFSPSFATNLEMERAERARLDAETAQRRLKAARATSDSQLVFFVALHTQNHFWNDLDRKKPTFSVKMYVDDDSAQEPDTIVRLGANEMANWSTLFPAISPLDTGYFVKFAAPNPKRHIRLLISGDPGAMEMKWNVAP